MFNLFKQRCPVCKMELEKDKHYVEESGKKLCSEHCKEEYRKQLADGQSKSSHGAPCH